MEAVSIHIILLIHLDSTVTTSGDTSQLIRHHNVGISSLQVQIVCALVGGTRHGLQGRRDRLEITFSLNQDVNFFFPGAPFFKRMSSSTSSGPSDLPDHVSSLNWLEGENTY